jgi:hypothetical protein
LGSRAVETEGLEDNVDTVNPDEDVEGQSPLHLVLCLNLEHLKHLTGLELLLNLLLQWEQDEDEIVGVDLDPMKFLTLLLIFSIANLLFSLAKA